MAPVVHKILIPIVGNAAKHAHCHQQLTIAKGYKGKKKSSQEMT
jgi:hypothetical protein